MGDPSDSVLLLLSGELEVLMDDEVSVATVRPVTTVGEMSYVTLRWTPSFGQPGSEVKVDSTGFVRLPFSIECIPPWVSCHR